MSPGAILVGVKKAFDVYSDDDRCTTTGVKREECDHNCSYVTGPCSSPMADPTYFLNRCDQPYKVNCEPTGETVKKAWNAAKSTCDKP